MATTVGTGSGTLASLIPDLADASNIQTALKQLYYGTTGGTLSQTTGVYGALYTLYSGNPTLAGSAILSNTNGVLLTSTNHALQVGPYASANLAVSPAIIQARNNGAASSLSINSLGGNVTIGDSNSTVTITGNLTVSGDTTTLNTATLSVEDAEIVIGNVAGASNTTANNGGIRLEAGSDGDKTITWDSSNTNWTTSEHWNLATGKTLKIANTAIASGTGTALVLGGNASTTLSLGANGGTASILNPTVTLTNATILNINGASPSIVTTSNGTAAVFNTNALTLNVGNAATTASLVGAATTLNIGNTATGAQAVNMFTASTGASTYNFATGNNSSNTKTINIGNQSGTTGSTNINLGSGSSGTVTVKGNLTMETAGKQLLLANGTTSIAPLKFGGTTVTNYLNASAGTMEYNGKAFIATPNAFSGQGFVATPYHTMLEGDVYITQSGGNTTAFGAVITLGPGYYEFELQIPFQFTYVTSATALSLGIKGTAVADGVYFLQEHFSNTGALTNLLLAAAVTNTVSSGRVQTNWRQNLASQSLNTSNLVSEMDSLTSGSRYGVYRARGWVNITTQGTFFPAASITGGGNGYIKAGAYAKITPLPSSESGYWSSQT
jgi:lipopolysaccharide export system protein LptA